MVVGANDVVEGATLVDVTGTVVCDNVDVTGAVVVVDVCGSVE